MKKEANSLHSKGNSIHTITVSIEKPKNMNKSFETSWNNGINTLNLSVKQVAFQSIFKKGNNTEVARILCIIIESIIKNKLVQKIAKSLLLNNKDTRPKPSRYSNLNRPFLSVASCYRKEPSVRTAISGIRCNLIEYNRHY